jgi:hypothetical protein
LELTLHPLDHVYPVPNAPVPYSVALRHVWRLHDDGRREKLNPDPKDCTVLVGDGGLRLSYDYTPTEAYPLAIYVRDPRLYCRILCLFEIVPVCQGTPEEFGRALAFLLKLRLTSLHLARRKR